MTDCQQHIYLPAWVDLLNVTDARCAVFRCVAWTLSHYFCRTNCITFKHKQLHDGAWCVISLDPPLCSPSVNHHRRLRQRQEEETHSWQQRRARVSYLREVSYDFVVATSAYHPTFACLSVRQVLCPVSADLFDQGVPAELRPAHPLDAAPERGPPRVRGVPVTCSRRRPDSLRRRLGGNRRGEVGGGETKKQVLQ